MRFHEEADCIQMLIDLLCYERMGRRLSPEASWLLHGHLQVCPGCLSKANGFLETLAEPESCPELAICSMKH
jgi:hypothetical protein